VDTTVIIQHYDDHGRPVEVTARHEALGVGMTPTQALVTATLPPFVGALTNETELGQLNIVAITRDAGLGDCLMMMPVMKKLRKMFPSLWLHVYVPDWCIDVIEWAAIGDDMMAIKPMQGHDEERYAKTVNLSWYVERQPEERVEIEDRVALFARAFGVELEEWEKRWHLRVPDDVPHLKLPTADKPLVALGTESAAPHRAPSIGLTGRIATALIEEGAHVILLGRNPPHELVYDEVDRTSPDLSVIANFPLADVAATMNRNIDCLVCGDTGLYHLAGAMGVPFVALFGAIPPKTRLMGYRNYGVVTAANKLTCVPCLERPVHIGCQPEPSCMDILDEKEIAKMAMKFAERRYAQRTKTSD
jgi:ADP-heptose:LPS heptosyltransferase